MKKQTNDLEGTCDNKYLGESAECEVEVNALNEIDKEWYTFVTNDKVEDSKIVENNEINFQAKEEQQPIDANGKIETFQCTFCQNSFRNLSNFRKHERVHTGKAPYECRTCKKRFTRTSSLKMHERIHTGEVPFECKTCKKRFKQKHHLKKHEQIHLRVKNTKPFDRIF